MKKILLVTDVYGWGGDVRGQYIKKHLSDEFDFDLIDGEEFKRLYCFNYPDRASMNEIHTFFPDDKRKEKEKLRTAKFIEYSEEYKKNNTVKSFDEYDLIYFLFHTMLLRKDVTRFLDEKRKIITIVTAYPTLRAGFYDAEEEKSKRRFLERANKCVAILANNLKSLNDLRSIYNGKTYLAVRGVDEKIFYPTKVFKEKPPHKYTVAYCGKKESFEKGLEDIIIPACNQAGVNLIFNTRNFTDALTPDQMREFYNQADVYIVASLMDGTPNTALEASACGLTLVSNEIGNMPELIKDSKNGFLVQERTIRRYVHRLSWMKRNQRIAWEIGQKGRQTVLNEWTWDKVLNKNERNIFREVI